MSATINYDYYDKKNIYDDGEVEEILYNHYKSGKKIDEKRDDIFYLTTDIRENIIAWYPFPKDSKVLEIGAGVGTITGKLCDMCSEVTALEASKRRAEIIYERHKDRDNLKVVVANINDYKTEDKYDYIIMIGVFEYSKLFFENEKPYDYFLNILKNKLNKKGKIIIAIENRYGIKYWAGNNEDHIGIPYQGFYGYRDVERVQTFGKLELIKLFEDNGYNNYRFYYAFPDYKMPQLILTDDYKLEEYELNSLPVYNMNLSDNYNFNPRRVLYGLQQNNQLGFFANSYICEISPDKCYLSDIAYAKFQPIRQKEYSTITIINKNKEVYKIPNNNLASVHLENINHIHEQLKKDGWSICKTHFSNQKLSIDYIEGISLENILLNNIKNEKKVVELIDNFIEEISKHCINKQITKAPIRDITKVYKKDETLMILKNNLLDLNFGNVIVSKDKFVIIDQEWECDYDIPLDFVVYFSIKLLFEKIKKTTDLEKKLYNHYKITEAKQKCFDKMSIYFFEETKKVNEKINIIKLSEHGKICINNKLTTLENDLNFYKELLDNTKNGYEKEIARISSDNNKKSKKFQDVLDKEIKRITEEQNERINTIQDAYEKEIAKLNKELLEQEKINESIKEENNRLSLIEKNPIKYAVKKIVKKQNNKG